MANPLTLRLDRQTRQSIARVARRKRISASQVVRDAIQAYLKQQEPADFPYQRIKHLIGVISSRDGTLSTETGRRFEELLEPRRGRS